MSGKAIITADQAIALLPDGRPYVHIYRRSPGLLCGCDGPREEIIAHIRKAKQCEIGGAACQAIKHALVITDDAGPLFIETDMAAVAALELAIRVAAKARRVIDAVRKQGGE